MRKVIDIQRYINLIKQSIKQVWIWMVRKDAFIYLLFVALATLFWWGRAMSSQREIEVKIPIEYTNIPAQVVFDNALPTHLVAMLRDNGRQLRQIQHTRPNIVIDLTNKLDMNDTILVLSTDMIRPKVQDVLPGTTAIQQLTPEEIILTYHTEAIKMVPIKPRAQWEMERQYQLTKSPNVEPATVNIYGTQTLLNGIDTIYTDSIFVGKIHGTMQHELMLSLPQGVRADVTTANITWESEQFTDKSFTIPIEVEGLPEGEIIHLFPKTTTLTVRVGISHFASVSSQDFRAVCQYPEHAQSTLSVHILYDTPYVTQMRSSIREVEYIIER